ncbi:ABC transporter permease [Streptomyces sp. AS02]|uniref:ABC transporter permease n=1 Tax=Streptomyces sp. AS02 TaxID=2938946 RepID=UPI0020214F6C|nr:ABC transporter permease [Streptomyces sp. AS02]MCL8017263.1 ABC transporter permease [Streptomyces sp. AS02]
MLGLIGRRLALAVPLLLGTTLLTFLLLALAPGDVARTLLGANASEQQVDALRATLGLDQPWYVQYGDWLGGAVRGDFGRSILTKQDVLTQLNQRLPVTLTLAALSTLVSGALGIALGVLGATRGRRTRRLVDAVAMLGFAIPNFWLGILLVSAFAVTIPLFPATGYVPFATDPAGWAGSLVLPVTTLAVGGVTLIAKQTRDAMLDVLSMEYIDALRADGWSERRITYRHALRNAALPVLTAIGVFFVAMLGGAVFVETIFAMPGLGRTAVTSTESHDIPLVLGVTTYFCIGVVLVNLLVDLAYGRLNPKVRTR